MAIATHFFNAKCFGGGIQNPEQLFVLIQAGAEMNMPPMEAVNSLYIVNGKITIYGSAMTKKLREAGWTINYDEKENEVTATIKKGDEEYSYTATAKELANSRAFKLAPRDKLKWHSISRLIRFYVPEVTNGIIKYIREEMDDYDFEMPSVKKELASPVMIERLKKKEADFAKLKEACQLEVDSFEELTQDEAVRCLTALAFNNKQ
jgi:hypothetical protein